MISKANSKNLKNTIIQGLCALLLTVVLPSSSPYAATPPSENETLPGSYFILDKSNNLRLGEPLSHAFRSSEYSYRSGNPHFLSKGETVKIIKKHTTPQADYFEVLTPVGLATISSLDLVNHFTYVKQPGLQCKPNIQHADAIEKCLNHSTLLKSHNRSLKGTPSIQGPLDLLVVANPKNKFDPSNSQKSRLSAFAEYFSEYIIPYPIPDSNKDTFHKTYLKPLNELTKGFALLSKEQKNELKKSINEMRSADIRLGMIDEWLNTTIKGPRSESHPNHVHYRLKHDRLNKIEQCLEQNNCWAHFAYLTRWFNFLKEPLYNEKGVEQTKRSARFQSELTQTYTDKNKLDERLKTLAGVNLDFKTNIGESVAATTAAKNACKNSFSQFPELATEVNQWLDSLDTAVPMDMAYIRAVRYYSLSDFEELDYSAISDPSNPSLDHQKYTPSQLAYFVNQTHDFPKRMEQAATSLQKWCEEKSSAMPPSRQTLTCPTALDQAMMTSKPFSQLAEQLASQTLYFDEFKTLQSKISRELNVVSRPLAQEKDPINKLIKCLIEASNSRQTNWEQAAIFADPSYSSDSLLGPHPWLKPDEIGILLPPVCEAGP